MDMLIFSAQINTKKGCIMNARTHKKNPLIAEIQNTFYNRLGTSALEADDILFDKIDDWMKVQIAMIIVDILELSAKSKNSIRLPTNTLIDESNCPTIYISFVENLLGIKRQFDLLDENDREELKNTLSHHPARTTLEKTIQALANGIMQAEAFKVTLAGAKQCILEIKGMVDIQPARRELDETGVTVELIRSTFYNEMPNQTLLAIKNELISRQDLEDLEDYIFFALSALTIIEAINQSRDFPGILLLGDKILTADNCPKEEEFDQLFIPILMNKEALTARSPEELMLIKRLCLSKNEEISSELLNHQNVNVMKCVSAINKVSSIISQREGFKKMIGNVIEFTLDSLGQEPETEPRKGMNF